MKSRLRHGLAVASVISLLAMTSGVIAASATTTTVKKTTTTVKKTTTTVKKTTTTVKKVTTTTVKKGTTTTVKKATTYTFNATYTGTIALLWNDSSASTGSITGSGTGAMFGLTSVTGTGSGMTTSQSDPINGTGTLSGGGSTLRLQLATGATAAADESSAPTTVRVNGNAKILGGTGIFANATGTLKVTGHFGIQNTSGSERDSYTATLTGVVTVNK